MGRHRLCSRCGSASKKRATYGYAGQSLRLYCGTCAAAGVTPRADAAELGALVQLDEETRKPRVGRVDRRQCEDCGVKAASFALPTDVKRRWCGGCRKKHAGAIDPRQRKSGREAPVAGCQPAQATKLVNARAVLKDLGADGVAALAALPRQPGQPPVAAVRARQAAGSGRHGVASVDWLNTEWPDKAKAEAAATRAQKFVGKSKLPATIKVLLKSHVSGSFWLQLPAAFCRCMPDTIKVRPPQVMFDLSGQSGDGLAEEVPDGDVWEVIWLPKGRTGGGLSGGWRGFSIDNSLAVGDTIAFEKLEGNRLQGTIFRAIPLAENVEYMARPAAEVAKVAAEVAAGRAKGLKRRYATITARDNAYRDALASGVSYETLLAQNRAAAAQKKVAQAAAAAQALAPSLSRGSSPGGGGGTGSGRQRAAAARQCPGGGGDGAGRGGRGAGRSGPPWGG